VCRLRRYNAAFATGAQNIDICGGHGSDPQDALVTVPDESDPRKMASNPR
jgi:hypothetical protein